MADLVGSRCDLDGHVGTIRFHGNVPPSSGVWYGVEWDEKRGKHDGSYEGKSYFQCRDQYGSFVRPHKVSLGVSIIEALEKRYGTGCDNLSDADMFVIGENKQKTAVKLVGFEKIQETQRQFEKLHKVGLVSMCISVEGEPDQLKNIAPNILDLDISRNLFTCWSQISDIAEQLHKLHILNISGNKLKIPDSVDKYCSAFDSLRTLFTNRMDLEWKQVSQILSMASNLTELHACFNKIHHINSLSGSAKHLKLLNLEGNKIESWLEIRKLSTLENLETLILNDNLISKIEFSDSDSPQNIGFCSLQAISLNNNKISQWSCINNLGRLVSLSSVRFKTNPVCEGHRPLDLRQELIARLRQAVVVNGSKWVLYALHMNQNLAKMVTPQERQNAELDYLNKYSGKWHAATSNIIDADNQNSLQAFKEQHPRFEELIKEYGEPSAKIEKKSKTLKEKLISLNFKCPDCEGKKSFTKKLPATMTIQQLKTLLQRLYKVSSYEQKLSYFDSQTDSEVEMNDNMRDLCFYSISQNDTILVRW